MSDQVIKDEGKHNDTDNTSLLNTEGEVTRKDIGVLNESEE